MKSNAVFCLILATALWFAAEGLSCAQVRFDADFESGVLGQVKALNDSCFTVHNRFDPPNPIDSTLSPSANWYYWRMTGIKGRSITLKLPDIDRPASCWSADGLHWQHFSDCENPAGKLQKRFESDTCYIASFVPYNWSFLRQRMEHWMLRSDVDIHTIGQSAEGRPLEMLHITDRSIPSQSKYRIWMHGRIHPSESPSSFLLDALIEHLSDDSPEARELRRNFEFYILPFANPDGVADGYSRCNALGINQEINFGRSDDSTCVEVRAMKREWERLCSERPLNMMINHHSQKDPNATFWLHSAESTSERFYGRLRTLTDLTCSFNPYLRQWDLAESKVASRYAEGWFWDRFAESTPAITIETPYTRYSNYTAVTPENLGEFGRRFLQAIAEYFGVSTPGRLIVSEPEEVPEGWEKAPEGYSSIGPDCLVATREGASISYTTDHKFRPGRYLIYRYVGSPGKGAWVFASDIFLLSRDKFEYTYTATAPGETADALLLLDDVE